MPMPSQGGLMFKHLARYFIFAAIYVFAVAAPSAFASNNSHSATFRAAHHGARHRGVAHRPHHGRRAIRLVIGQPAVTLSSAVLLGESSIESHVDYVTAGQAEAFRLQANGSDVAGIAHVYVDSRNAARTLLVGLYSNGAGHPVSLLSTGSVSAVQPGAWNAVSLTPTSLASGKTYWLAILGEGGTLRYRDRDKGPCPSETSAQTNLTALSASWKTGRLYTTCPVSAYVTAAPPVFGPPSPVEPVPIEPTPVKPPPVEPTPVEPAPVVAPINTVPPAISGTTTGGQLLGVTSGTWSGSPTSYTYQWQDCDSSGTGCVSVNGATGASYTLASSDVAHTMRTVVTASNAAGSSSVSSTATAIVASVPPPPPPAPPTASFTVTPTSPVVGQTVTFDGSGSGCPNGPCAYAWSDDGSTTRPIPALWLLGSGSTLEYKFSGAGTKYVRLVVTDATGQTATVEHNVVVEAAQASPTPPSNMLLPSVSGAAQVGQTLTASNGAWSGSTPLSYTYQWQACNTSGEACSDVSGATSATHMVVEGDVGHTLRAVVTATNSVGSATAFSAATAAVVAAVSAKCTTTDSSSMSASSIASSIVSAADGSTVCLASGSYPFIHIVGAAHNAYVTVRPASGATAIIAGAEVANSSFLRFEGLKMTEGFNMRDSSTAASHDYQFIQNTFAEPLYGIVLFGGSGPIKRVLIEGNYMHYVHLSDPEVAGKCSAGYAQGQDVTIDNAEGVTIAHNTFNEAAWHYIQGGGAGPEGVNVEYNLFEGHILMACSHLNLWQIWAGGENDTFKNNVAVGQGRGMKNGLSEEAATDGVIFENGPGSVECGTTMKNSVIENNLFINAATSYELQIYTTESAMIKNNTVVGSEWGTALLTEHCGAGSNYTMTHNIDVENQGSGGDFGFGACSGACLFDYNVSQDSSASQAGSTHYMTNWSPKWTTTAWSPATEPTAPAGFYAPTGLSIEAGYQGNIGP
jgi:PKD domain